MKLKNFTVLVLLLFLAQVQSQNISAIKRDFYAFDADYFAGFDGFNSYYYVKDNVLYKKYEETIIQYQNLAFGKIKKVDLLNPLKIVIFYSDFNTVVVLDNQLNEIQKIEFSRLETPIIVSSTGISGQNKLWFFNTLNQQIGLYDLTTIQNQ